MFPKLLCLCVALAGAAATDALGRLRAAPAARETLWAAPAGAHCAGALWRRCWLLVRASCVLPHPLSSIYVQRGVVNCSQDSTTLPAIATGEPCTRSVIAVYKHPMYPEQDLALLQLDWPFASSELIENYTISGNLINELDDWMKNINFMETLQYQPTSSYNRRYHKMYSTPMRMFLVTVVLPSTSFIVFFLFIIFFTSKSRGNKIPYRNLNNENKETTHV